MLGRILHCDLMKEIWMVDLAGSKGHEQKKKRPGIIWKDLDHLGLVIVIPCTSNLNQVKFPHTFKIYSNIKNCLDQDSVALIYQITTIDKNRLLDKVGILENEDETAISALLKNLLKL